MAADFECPWPLCLNAKKAADGKIVGCELQENSMFGCPIRHDPKKSAKAPVVINIPVNVVIKIEPGTRVCQEDLYMIEESARDGVIKGTLELLKDGDL